MSERCTIGELRPNGFNPNELSPGKMKSLIHEMRRKGINLKPILVRVVDDVKEIIDGEHTWNAAKAAKLSEVTIEITTADNFEARRLCVRSNLGGEANSVKLGKLISEMQQERSLDNREIANELGVSEGTVRNRLLYWEAAKKAILDRTMPTEAEIAELPIRKLRELLGEDEETVKKTAARPIDKAKKLVQKMTQQELEAFVEWLIPSLSDQNPCAHLRNPMDMMSQG